MGCPRCVGAPRYGRGKKVKSRQSTNGSEIEKRNEGPWMHAQGQLQCPGKGAYAAFEPAPSFFDPTSRPHDAVSDFPGPLKSRRGGPDPRRVCRPRQEPAAVGPSKSRRPPGRGSRVRRPNLGSPAGPSEPPEFRNGAGEGPGEAPAAPTGPFAVADPRWRGRACGPYPSRLSDLNVLSVSKLEFRIRISRISSQQRVENTETVGWLSNGMSQRKR